MDPSQAPSPAPHNYTGNGHNNAQYGGYTDWLTETTNDLRRPEVVGIMVVSLLVSLGVFAVALVKAFRQPKRFNLGVVFGCALLVLNDAWYYVVYAGAQHVGSYGMVHVVTSVMVPCVIAGLSFERFRVFAATQYARWYTNRVRHALLAIDVLLLIGITSGLLYSYIKPLVDLKNVDWSHHAPADRARMKAQWDPSYRGTLVGIMLTFSVGADLIFTGLTIWIVLKIRRDIYYSGGHAQASTGDARLPAGPSDHSSGTSSGQHPGFPRGSSAQPLPPLPCRSDEALRESVFSYKQRERSLLQGNVYRVLVCLGAMLLLGLGGVIATAVTPQLKSLGDSLSGLCIRLYIVAAIVQWYLIVDIVGARETKKSTARK
ncbi:hypothetical protein RI367_007820 [Sorochytrium milnesiophthora]